MRNRAKMTNKSKGSNRMEKPIGRSWTCNRSCSRATPMALIVILMTFCPGPPLSDYQILAEANINYSIAESQDANINANNNYQSSRYYHQFNYETTKLAAQKEHNYVMMSNKVTPLAAPLAPQSQNSTQNSRNTNNNINPKSFSSSTSTTPILSKSSEILSKLQSEHHLAPLPPNKQQIIDRQQQQHPLANHRHHNHHDHKHLTSQPDHQQQAQQQNQQPFTTSNKICTGTSNKLANQHNRTDHYQNLVDRYKNCTFVIGNLEITWIERGRDLNFLESIREISGYLLIANVEVERIRLPNLQIIRGRDQYNHDGRDYAFFLIDNELKTVELPNLTEILSGSYGSYHNRNLCYLNTINWEEILHPPYESYNVYDGFQPSCPSCNPLCSSGSCWGEGPDNCQRFTKVGCSCGQGRCFGPSPSDCCHSYCAGGCTGPKETHCLACKNFFDDGTCVTECPSILRYIPEAFESVPNPKGKYAYGAFCVKDCPPHLLRDNGACVRTCPANKRSVNGECVSCIGPCPKNCLGVEVVHSGNIDQLINCTVIEGSITISDLSFFGSPDAPHTTQYVTSNSNATTAMTTKYKPMHPYRLEALKNLREITGFLNIQQAYHPDFKNLSFFRNLMYIGGRQQTDYSLTIMKTSLVSLNLHSLRKVRSGKILIEDNKNLCFADTIDWAQTNITRKDEITTRNNADPSKCRSMGLQCHEQCARDGCWGSGPDECLSCNNYKLDDYCVDNCSSSLVQIGLLSYVDGPRICKRCHSECAKGCRGSEAKNCFECKNVKDGPYCVPECPSHKYNKDGICRACDPSCLDGCTGPSNKLGEGGCNSCSKVVLNSTDGQLSAHCILAEETCPDGFYQEYVGPQVEGLLKSSSGKPVCRKCHHRCKSCTGMGTHTSVCVCAKYVAGEQCEESCPRDHYEDEQSRRCLKCSSECNGCFGPTEADCLTCRVYRIYHSPLGQMQDVQSVAQVYSDGLDSTSLSSKSTPRFNCTAQCPPDKPKRISDKSMLDPYCSEDDGVDSENTNKNALLIAYAIMLGFVLFGIACCLCICRFQRQNDKTVKLTMHLSGIDDVEPLHPSNLKPNLAPLRSIKESELRRGKILGSGFGGTVYQGLWRPEGREHKNPLPVAIKVLRDNGESNMNKEFLDEAYIMASVKHPNLVRLLAVCMTPSHLMLVTQLMPLGCLLDYVKKHRDDIGSKNLFEWCKQIARGMAYLEENRMVHRDLALRNVLLQKSGLAVVSDFGLAKFLDIDQSEYHSGGGRLPIKWLAPECISQRKFTHKSDVWAFGVTVWELMTFGMRPFEEYSTREVYHAIEIGARLCQPSWMTAEVYKELYACWFYNPDERPDFKYLEQKFIKFAQDPERYLICRTKGIDYSLNVDSNGKSSDCDDHLGEEYNSDLNDFTEDDSQPPSAIAPELTPSTHNRLNEINVFGFEQQLRNNANHDHNNNNIVSINDSESESQQTAITPICKSRTNLYPGSPRRKIEEEFFMTPTKPPQNHNHNHQHPTSIDLNNNSSSNTDNNCWRMIQQTMSSSNSLAHKSDQPTDGYDYLIPSLSPSTNEHSQFGSFYESNYDFKSIPIAPTSSKATSTLPLRNPPHSAGPIGIQNEEYFLNGRVNYVNYRTDTTSQHLKANADRLSASNNNIPHSLV